jgi:predicted nicotinamide N-methyase
LVCTQAAKVVFTDIHVPALHNIQYNIDLNLAADQRSRAVVRTMDWYDSKTWGEEKFDIVIGTDLVYNKQIVTPLMNVMKALVKPNGVVQYVVRAHSDRV